MVGIKGSLRDVTTGGEDFEEANSVNEESLSEEDDEEQQEGIEASFYLVSPTESIAIERTQMTGGSDYDSDDGSVACNWEDGAWVCQPYRREMISAEILKANRRGEKGHMAVLNLLKQSGVRVYVVDAKVSSTVGEIMTSIRSAIKHVRKIQSKKHNNTNNNSKGHGHQRCLLYKDREGRFFNLTLAEYTTAPEYAFKDYLTSFSGIQAMSVLTILCRSFACTTESEIVEQDFRPAYLGLLLGLVFVEEISYSWINTAMLVRGVPSISAYTITTHVETDWLRKTLVFCLALSSATTGRLQFIMTFFGISLACAVLLANLGSRAWGFLGWRPLTKGGMFESVIAYIAAIAVGLTIPYMGHREVGAGGQAAMESVLRSAIIVAFIFVISDYDEFQKFLVIGSENCNQDIVNMTVSVWWGLSLLVSLFLVLNIPQPSIMPDEEEPLLQADQASPVGYKLPALPDFPIDPILEQKGSLTCLNLKVEFVIGVSLTFGIGGGIFYLAFTDFDEDLAANNIQFDNATNDGDGFFSMLSRNNN